MKTTLTNALQFVRYFNFILFSFFLSVTVDRIIENARSNDMFSDYNNNNNNNTKIYNAHMYSSITHLKDCSAYPFYP